MTAQTGLKRLERKVNLLSKALNLLLFEEKERISKNEAREIERRLSAYQRGKKNQFVSIEAAFRSILYRYTTGPLT